MNSTLSALASSLAQDGISPRWRRVFLALMYAPVFFIRWSLDNDVWFLLNGGRYVLAHGIPHTEPFSMHEGFRFVMQQWLTGVLYYDIYRAAEINTITVGDVQRIIDAPILAKIPSDYMTAVSALNRGVPFVQGAPNSKLSQSVGELANLLITGTENYDIQKLPPKERRQLANKYRVKEKKPLTLFNRK